MAHDDAKLVNRCLRGDTQAIRELVERYQSGVFGLCYRLLNHKQDAEDAVQEVFLRVFRSLERWDSTRELRPWILGIAFNRCRTQLAKRARQPESVAYLHDTIADRPAHDAGELAQEIQMAVNELRTDYRSVFIMFHEQGMPYDQIADALGRPVGTIKTWLHRCRLEVLNRLRERGMVTEVEHELS